MNLKFSHQGWRNVEHLESRAFICGYCTEKVASSIGYQVNATPSGGRIYKCPHCQGPNVFDKKWTRAPDVKMGATVQHVPDDLNTLYEEARICTSTGCHTAAVLLLRKMLMNIAVNKGANEGLKFIDYVDYLSNNGFVPPDGKGWVDHIRKKGNEATHEISNMQSSDLEDLVSFVEMLLRYIYEFSGRLSQRAATPSAPKP